MIIKTFDVTGFPEDYEHAVQQMIWQGVEWLQKNCNPNFKSMQSKNIIGLAINEGDIGKQFDKALGNGIEGYTGAMHHCATNHALYIANNGYKKWFEKLSSRENHDDDDNNQPYDYEFNGEVNLTT